jgi:hypothetical protein
MTISVVGIRMADVVVDRSELMMTRRRFAASSAAFPSMMVAACTNTPDQLTYDGAVRQTFRHAEQFDAAGPAAYRELVRYATMAANSHNTQPWAFRIDGDRIRLVADLDRRCPVVDPDDHHVFASLGCAAENIMTAASAFGLKGHLAFEPTDASITLSMERTTPNPTPAFQAIPARQCTRATFNGEAVPVDVLKQVEIFAASPVVDLHLLTGQSQKL